MNIEAYDHMRFAIARCGMAVLSLTSAMEPGSSKAEVMKELDVAQAALETGLEAIEAALAQVRGGP
jgi:hypothetical protein